MSNNSPNYWETYVENMCNDIDKINSQIDEVFSAKFSTPPQSHPKNRNRSHSPRKHTNENVNRSKRTFHEKTQAQLISQERKDCQDEPTTNYFM